MAEFMFERELERMFAEAPAFPDAQLFAVQVEERLARGWTFRRFLIGGLGAVGGVIGGAQLLGSGVLSRAGELTAASQHYAAAQVAQLLPTNLTPSGFPLGEALWMSAALALVAVGLALTRAIREI